MSESEVGRTVAATRQNAGRSPKDPLSGAAAVISVSGSAKINRLAHVAAADGLALMPTSDASRAVASNVALWMHLMAALRLPAIRITRRVARGSCIPALSQNRT